MDAAANNTAEIAIAYLALYQNFNETNGLGDYYTDQTVFSDPTYSPDTLVGREQILERIRNAATDTVRSTFSSELLFTSGEYAIFKFTHNGRYSVSSFAASPTHEFFDVTDLQGISIIRIQQGKVIEHTDYSGMDTWWTQFADQGFVANEGSDSHLP